jgi:hypothetical protein
MGRGDKAKGNPLVLCFVNIYTNFKNIGRFEIYYLAIH